MPIGTSTRREEVRLRFAFAAIAILASVSLRPPPLLACTGCPEPFSEVVREADRIALVSVTGASPTSGYTFAVERVFKGPVATHLSFGPDSIQDFPLHTRWVLVLYPGHALEAANAWRVQADGRLANSGPFEAPATLRGLIAWFAMPATDTLTPAEPDLSLPWVAFAGLFGLLVACIRLRPAADVDRRRRAGATARHTEHALWRRPGRLDDPPPSGEDS